MTTADNDCQFRIRKIDNGFLVISGSHFFCHTPEEVHERVTILLDEWQDPKAAKKAARKSRKEEA